MLSDEKNRVAKAFGLVFTVPEALWPIYVSFGIDIPAHNGDDSFELPLPATDGTIVHAFVNTDYQQRQDPEGSVAALKQLAVAA